MTEIKIHNLTKRFPNGVEALRGITLTLHAGEATILLGANGSGKSTLLRCIVGLERPSSGVIHVGAVESTQAHGRELRDLRRQVGFVFQRFNLVGNLSAFHNVLLGALGRSRGLHYWHPATAPSHERDKAMHCLARVGLAQLATRRADTLSGGQQQRLALARTLMQEPKVILADEPVASLDPKAGREVMDLLWEVCKQEGLTLICALHQLDLALEYGERLIGLQTGRVVLDRYVAGAEKSELEAIYRHSSVEENDDLTTPAIASTLINRPTLLGQSQ